MFLVHVPTKELVDIVNISEVFNPKVRAIRGRPIGEVVHRATYIPKSELAFQSGEPLPQCWVHVDEVAA